MGTVPQSGVAACMSRGNPLPRESAATTGPALIGGLVCLGGTALLCCLATVIVAGSTSHHGASAAGTAMLWLLSAEALLGNLALVAYAVLLVRRRVPWWGLWWGAVAISMGLGMAMLVFVTLVMFNR
jgi:hypothetical protein